MLVALPKTPLQNPLWLALAGDCQSAGWGMLARQTSDIKSLQPRQQQNEALYRPRMRLEFRV